MTFGALEAFALPLAFVEARARAIVVAVELDAPVDENPALPGLARMAFTHALRALRRELSSNHLNRWKISRSASETDSMSAFSKRVAIASHSRSIAAKPVKDFSTPASVVLQEAKNCSLFNTFA